jgi:hypothetical protein
LSEITCIYCLKKYPKGSVEHIFPDALGGTLVINDVCTNCNNTLGKNVDSHLTNHSLMLMERQLKKIRGKSGKIPNPLAKGVLAEDNETQVHYRFDDAGDPQGVYLVPKVKQNDNEFQISVDASEPHKLVEIVNKILKRHNKDPMSKEEILNNANYGKPNNPTISYKTKVDFNSYRKGILKIIYELSYYLIGKEYLHDETGKKLREYIMSDDVNIDGLKGFAGLVSEKKTSFSQLFGDKNAHFGLLKIDGMKIHCYVNLFNTFEGGMIISEEAGRYTNLIDSFIYNNTVTKEHRKNSLIDEINRRHGN